MKRFVLFLMVCLAVVQPLDAQFALRSLSSGNQQLIEEAVRDGLFVVRQSYQLRDSVTSYGWNNLPQFGTTYSLGVKVVDGYYLDAQAVTPWLYDPKFDEYRDSKQYTPVISQTDCYRLSDTTFRKVSFRLPSEGVGSSNFQFVTDSLFANEGFAADNSDGAKAGWLVWVVSADSLDKITAGALSLLIYRNELKFEAGENTYKIDAPTTTKTVVGGIYIVPKTEGIGKISFYLGGIAHRQEGDWRVVRLGESEANVQEVAGQARNDKKGKGGLTPIKTTKKIKK
ncbi:hypothetical protein SAMD00024442_1_11 [Candidatus Symbiothrix dinenymphae]|nr:hypothetical protein SAMD00024442_1_11 [Candidatus Symbiothrix dinenymphae]